MATSFEQQLEHEKKRKEQIAKHKDEIVGVLDVEEAMLAARQAELAVRAKVMDDPEHSSAFARMRGLFTRVESAEPEHTKARFGSLPRSVWSDQCDLSA